MIAAACWTCASAASGDAGRWAPAGGDPAESSGQAGADRADRHRRRRGRRHDLGRVRLADHRRCCWCSTRGCAPASWSAPTWCRRSRWSASAALGHVIFGDFQLGLTAALLVGAIPGVYIGARLSRAAPADRPARRSSWCCWPPRSSCSRPRTCQLLLALVVVGMRRSVAVDGRPPRGRAARLLANGAEVGPGQAKKPVAQLDRCSYDEAAAADTLRGPTRSAGRGGSTLTAGRAADSIRGPRRLDGSAGRALGVLDEIAGRGGVRHRRVRAAAAGPAATRARPLPAGLDTILSTARVTPTELRPP